MKRCVAGLHVFAKATEEPCPIGVLETREAWLPDFVVCVCGWWSWGEMNARLRETEAAEAA